MRARFVFSSLVAVPFLLLAAGPTTRGDPAVSARDPSAADSAGVIRIQGIPLSPEPLDTVFVVGERPVRALALRRQSTIASVLDVDRVRGPAESAPDLLERCVGLSVRRYGGPGAMATISIRGADPGQVEVFLDRTPLRTASQGLVDLSAVDLSQIESVEIYRSAAPPDLGGEASSSAIRLVTRSGGARRARVRLSTGSYGTREIEGWSAGSWRGQRYFVSASRFTTRGDFRYFNDNGTAVETGDDAWLHWTNGDARRENLLARLTLALPRGLDFDVSTQRAARDQGVPGTSRQPTHQVRSTSLTWLHRGELSAEGALRPALYGYVETTDRSYRDPLRELHVTGTPRQVDQAQWRRGAGLQLRHAWPAPWPVLGTHRLEALGELRREVLRKLPLPGRPEEDRRRRDARLLSFGDEAELLRGRLGLSAFYRWERGVDNFTGADPWQPFAARPEHIARAQGPRLGLRVTLGAGHTLKANWAHQARFPTFSELFGYAGTVQGNAALRPEIGTRRDMGWIWEPDRRVLGLRWRAEGAYYQSELEQMIVMVTVSDRETRPQNLDRARIRGAELSLTLDELPAVAGVRPALAGNLHWQDARDEGASPVYHGKQLTYHPPLQAHVRCDLTRGPVQLTAGAHYRAAAYWGRSNLPQFRGPAQWSGDAALRCAVPRVPLVAALRVENLSDAHIEDVRGYPLPGRSWYLEMTWSNGAPTGANAIPAVATAPEEE